MFAFMHFYSLLFHKVQV